MKPKKSATPELVSLCCRALEDKKAGDVAVLDVSAQSSITDYLIVATATSEPHLRALRIELEKVLDAAKVHLVGMDAIQESGWVVIDAFDVMVHLFLAEARERYGLERLWRDAVALPLAKVLPSAAKAARPKKKAPAKATAKAPKKAARRTRS